MVKSRALALLGGLALVAVIMPLPALADPASDGRITARWESVYAPSVARAVRVNGMWRAAGETYFRVDGQADVAMYSLSLATPVDRNTDLGAVDADTSAIPHLDQVTSLVRSSAADASRGRLTSTRAAAYQIAIWHFTDGLSIDRAHVPKRAIRSAVNELIRRAVTRTDRVLRCRGSQCADPLSTAATVATLNVRVGSTVDDTVLRIAIITPIRRFFNTRQYVDLRINGLGATLCPGEVDRIRVDEPATHDVLKSSCGFRAHDPAQKGTPHFADLPRLIVQRISASPMSDTVNNVITTQIPRQDSSQEIQVSWDFNNAPGMVFLPASASSPIISASTFSDTRNAAVTIDPVDFANFQEAVQRTVLPIFTSHGIWGLLLLALLLVMLLVLKDWVTGITNWLGRIIRKGWSRLWAWLKRKASEMKARRAAKQAVP